MHFVKIKGSQTLMDLQYAYFCVNLANLHACNNFHYEWQIEMCALLCNTVEPLILAIPSI